MQLLVRILLGVAAVGAFATAAAFSLPFFAYLGAALAILSLALPRVPRASQPVKGGALTGTDASLSSVPGDPASQAAPPSSATPDPPDPPCPEMVAPTSVDVISVADALLASARRAGTPERVTIWRADGALEEPVVVADSGATRCSVRPSREALDTAISEGTTVFQSLVLGADPQDVPSRWRYVIPISFSGIRGAAAIDLVGTRPDVGMLNRVASAFRLPLAAALALGVARSESESARALVESARDLARILDPDEVVSSTLRRAVTLTDAASGSIMLYEEDGATLRIASAVGLPTHVVRDAAVRPGDGIAGWVALSGQPLVVEDLPGRTTPVRSRGIRSAVSVPLADEDGVLGVLNIGRKEYPSSFTATDLQTLESLARQATVAIRNARAVSSAEDIYFDTLRALSLALETKDPYALGGTDRVMHYAGLLGEAMGLERDESRALEIAAMLHDIGMSAAGETALITQRPLSTVERGMLKMHPVIAAEILDQAPALREVAPIVYHHHERYDGTGYVGGVSGESIPLGARILAVADAFVAMTSDRPYRAAMSEAEALEELRTHAGTQFDPAVIDTFMTVVMADPNRVHKDGA